MFQLLKIILLFIIFFEAQALNDHRYFNHFDDYDERKETKITNAEYIYACHSDKCQKIKEFSIAKNITHNCYNQYLAIEFEVTDVTDKKISTFGYLSSQKGLSLSNNQQNSSICRKIKRLEV